MPARTAARRGAKVASRPARGARGGGADGRERAQGAQPQRFAEIQRARLLAAAVRAVDELGYPDTSVADITSRARVSRRTFYELFADREACLATVIEDILGLLGGELAAAGLEGLGWRERVRGGLLVILGFLDREPVLARVLVVQALRGGPRVLQRREAVLARLAGVVDEGRLLSVRAQRCTPLTAEGLVGAAFSIVYARLLRGERRPLTGLVGELMGMIVLPYQGAATAHREQVRPAPAPAKRRERARRGSSEGVVDPLGGVSMRLTYRTARVLEGIAELGGRGSNPSNREVGERAGIADAGQVSKLLARLERLGLLANTGSGRVKGEPNAWALTAKGEMVARSIRMHAPAVDESCAGAPGGVSLFTDRGVLPSVLEEEMVR
jgi:AcrR family transcriptional regulator